MAEHLFPIDGERYRLVTDKFQHWAALKLQYRELVIGTPFTMTAEVVTMPKGSKVAKDAAEQFRKDFVENVVDGYPPIAGVVVEPGGYYRLKKPKVFLTNSEHVTTKLFETFYRWAPHEFKDTILSFSSGVNESVAPLGLELVPIKDDGPDFDETMIVEVRYF